MIFTAFNASSGKRSAAAYISVITTAPQTTKKQNDLITTILLDKISLGVR
jgi:hypothetical protein